MDYKSLTAPLAYNQQSEFRRQIQLFQIYDTVAQQVIGPIIPAPQAAPAVRHFVDLLKDKTTTLAQHPSDYVLLRIGTQDELTGSIDPLLPPVAVLTGAAWAASLETTSA